MVILGIDPGSIKAGFGLIRIESGGSITPLHHGAIDLGRGDFSHRLKLLGEHIDVLIRRWKPNVTVLERIFLGKNADSAFKLGHARGVCMYEAKKGGGQIVEYAAREVKKGITGKGNAEKEQVALLVMASLGLSMKNRPPLDATDALALAFHHAVLLQVRTRLGSNDLSL